MIYVGLADGKDQSLERDMPVEGMGEYVGQGSIPNQIVDIERTQYVHQANL